MTVQIIKDNFEELLSSDKLLIIDFWAEWCSPCRMLSPVMKELAFEYKSKIIVGTINVDQNNALSTKYKIQSIPTLLFFKKKQLVYKHIGSTNKKTIEEKIKTFLV